MKRNRVLLLLSLVFIVVFANLIRVYAVEQAPTKNFDSFVDPISGKYIIEHEIDLEGACTTISNAELVFRGGSITNGTVLLNRVALQGDVKIYAKIDQSSNILNSQLDVTWFTPNVNCGAKNVDVSDVINTLIRVSQNYGDGQYRSSNTIYMPAGIYYCKKPICLYLPDTGERVNEIHIKGDMGSKVIAAAKMEYLFGRDLANSGSDKKGTDLLLEDIVFDGNFNVQHTLNLSRVCNSTMRNIKAMAGLQTNLYMNYAFINNFYDCQFLSWDVFRPTNIDVYLGPQDVNAVNFRGCRFECANLGIYSANGYVVNLDGCTLEGLRSAAVYVRNTDQFSIKDCYFEDVSTTRRSNKHATIDWKTFGYKGKSILVNGSKKNVPFEIHADIIVNPHKLMTDEDFTNSVLEITDQNVQSFTSQRMLTCIGNSSQRINSCSYDNAMNYTIPNDCFIFAASTQGIYATANSLCCIYVDDKNHEYHWPKEYTPQLLLCGKYGNVNNIANIILSGNTSANKQVNSFSIVEFRNQ